MAEDHVKYVPDTLERQFEDRLCFSADSDEAARL
jgi:hypothetical protein